MDYFALITESKDKNDMPIAKFGNKIIYLHKTHKFDKSKTEIIGNNIEPIPFIPENQNLRYFIGGQSGCGKSTLTAMILKNYFKLYPKQELFIFSALLEDPTLDNDPLIKNKMKRINIKDLDDIEVMNLKNSICVFDDASGLPTALQKKLDLLQDEINKRGRHFQIDIINVVDKFLDGPKTNKKFLHATFVGYFVHTGGNKAELKYMFDKKLGLDKNQAGELLGGNSRWSLYHKQYPNFLIEQNRVLLI